MLPLLGRRVYRIAESGMARLVGSPEDAALYCDFLYRAGRRSGVVCEFSMKLYERFCAVVMGAALAANVGLLVWMWMHWRIR
jgi:hypothetical protein